MLNTQETVLLYYPCLQTNITGQTWPQGR